MTSSTETSGRPNIATVIAPIPMATPAIIGSPGRCDNAMPPAAPMNMRGEHRPPRKLVSAAL